MTSLSRRQIVALLIPFLLIPSTAFVFVTGSQSIGPQAGYILGFIFYWIVWCFLVPILMLGASSTASLFQEKHRLFQRSNLLPAALLVVILVITVVMYPPSRLASASTGLLLIAIPVAVINGIAEEVLWRGVYVSMYPNSIPLAVMYPSLGFALWHIAPQLVLPAESGIWSLVISTFFLGISYGWIAFRTRSVRWPVIAHSIGGVLSLGGFIAPSIAALLGL